VTKLLSPRLIFSFFIILGIGMFSWFYYFSSAFNGEEVYLNEELAQSNKAALLDSDKDGLKDWEEVLWETDPMNADTDGDGIPDGQEASHNNTGSPENAETPNFTEAFSQAFANAIGPRILEENGLADISKSDLEGIAGFIPNPEAILGETARISASDLKISDKNDASSVKKYFNELHHLAYESAFAGITEGDITSFIKFLETENSGELEKIDPVINAFGKSIDAIKNLPTPKGYENFALTEANILSRMKRADEIIRNADKDLLAAVAVIKARFAMEEELNAFHQEFKKTLSEKGIIFSPTDKGYKFFD